MHTMPRGSMCRRPTDFKSAMTVVEACSKGLPESWKLGAQDEESSMKLTSWLEVLEKKISRLGMDTPFFVVHDKERRQDQQHLPILKRMGIKEINILKEWAMVGDVNITEWEDILSTEGCTCDENNLERSGEFILRSLTTKLSDDVTSVMGMNPSGPRVLQEVISMKQQLDASGVRELEQSLQSFELKHEAAENVVEHAKKITPRIKKLANCVNGQGVPHTRDLSTLVAKGFTKCSAETFRIEAISLHTLCNRNPSAMK